MNSLLQALPIPSRGRVRERLVRLARPAWLGTLHRTTPLSRHWGTDRGTPVDRYYIEQFLDAHRGDIRGHVLEIKDATYVNRFGSAVTHVDVLDIDPRNPHATIVADLASPAAVEDEQFDCIVLTQTLQFVFDLQAAVRHLHRMLRPGGVLLATAPSITRNDAHLLHTDYWRFTAASCQRLVGDQFGAADVSVQTSGNVLAAIAFLAGMAREELSDAELAVRDELFPVIVTIRACK
jgi:SAM-dependent methyltransferase